MLVILAFCAKDKPSAILLAEWLRDLGGVSEHECMLVFPPGVECADLLVPLTNAFKSVTTYQTGDDRNTWPSGPNLLMRRTCTQIQYTKPRPWLWLEPDAIPLRSTWLDEIAAEYAACKKPFMGARVELPNVPLHMSGIGVYPGNAPTLAPGLLRADKTAFDVEAAKEIIPRAFFTSLIQHEWKPKSFPDAGSLVRLSPEAVIYHQSKDGALIRRLREQREGGKTNAREAIEVINLPVVRYVGPAAAPTSNPSAAATTSIPPEEKLTPREFADHHANALAALAVVSHANRITVGNALKRAGLLAAKAKTSRRKKAKSV